MIRLALRNPYVVIVAALATIVLGITSFRKIPADLLPIFKTPAVQIVTFYPGMPPEVMERDIMSRLERWTGQSVGIGCFVREVLRTLPSSPRKHDFTWISGLR